MKKMRNLLDMWLSWFLCPHFSLPLFLFPVAPTPALPRAVFPGKASVLLPFSGNAIYELQVAPF